MFSAGDDPVAAAHATWQDWNERLRRKEAELSAALELYSAGRGPLPQDLMDQARQLRKECNARFEALLTAMKARRP